jgi:hypothetical protein
MHPNPRKTSSIRHLGDVDVSLLREQVLAIPESVWDAENASKPNKYDALSSTRHIVFRFVSSPRHWGESYDRPVWEAWRALLQPVMDGVTAQYGYVNGGYPRILLARMAPGGVIHPHVDANPAALWPHKIHVPITTNPQVTFFIGEEGHKLEVGKAYEVNNLGRHAVSNAGDSDRIHLIFEYYDRDQPEG